MANEPAYCSWNDLLIGDLPLPSYIDVEKVIVDAADEIDSKIGFIYKTRIDVSDASTVVKPARLLLKRLNVFIASGRLLMNVATAGEDTRVHAYAARLLREAEVALVDIAQGRLLLEGADRVKHTDEVRGPVYGNKDPESYVEAFYDRVVNPRYSAFGFDAESEHGLIR